MRTSFDHFVYRTGHGQNSYQAAREAAGVANQEEMDRRSAQNQFLEDAAKFKVNLNRVQRAWVERTMASREAITTHKQQELKRDR